MTDHQFKNGITVHIPDDMENLQEEWTDVKVKMSLILHPPPAVDPKPERKPQPPITFETKKKISKSLKVYFNKRKTWRSPKKHYAV